jgi:hypothetical protein
MYPKGTCDHAFCLVGAPDKPSWGTSGRGIDGDQEGVWIIDPWANLVCKPNEYRAKLTAKMESYRKEILVGKSWESASKSFSSQNVDSSTLTIIRFNWQAGN